MTVDAWALAMLFVPLFYVAVLGRREEPVERLVALFGAIGVIVKAIAHIIGRWHLK
ncbi:MAG: hypothetical protein K2Z76_01710 [Mycobacterium gordonae]|nr:hypothetical protein [Mycobacterium gordonae]